MKKIPEKYELDQLDIEDAITEWLNSHNESGRDHYIITLKRETIEVDPSEPIEQYYYTAVAEKE